MSNLFCFSSKELTRFGLGFYGCVLGLSGPDFAGVKTCCLRWWQRCLPNVGYQSQQGQALACWVAVSGVIADVLFSQRDKQRNDGVVPETAPEQIDSSMHPERGGLGIRLKDQLR